MKYGFYFQFLELLMSLFLMIFGMSLQAKEYYWSIVFLVLGMFLQGLYLILIQIINKNGTILLPFWFSLMPKKIRDKLFEVLK